MVPGAGYSSGLSGRSFRPRALAQSGLHLLSGTAAGRYRQELGRAALVMRAAARGPRVHTSGRSVAYTGAVVALPQIMK